MKSPRWISSSPMGASKESASLDILRICCTFAAEVRVAVAMARKQHTAISSGARRLTCQPEARESNIASVGRGGCSLPEPWLEIACTRHSFRVTRTGGQTGPELR